MVRRSGISAPIYKLDRSAVESRFGDISAEAVEKLVDDYNREKGKEIYALQGSAVIGGRTLIMYKNIESQPNVLAWVRFFADSELRLEKLVQQTQHLACFVQSDAEIFAFTAGQGAVLFEHYVDTAWPIAVGRRISKPEVKTARANQITGLTLASDIHFRDARRITHTESLDTVWTALSGSLREDILGEPVIGEIFGKKRKIGVKITSSVRIAPLVSTPGHLVALVDWLDAKADADPPADDGWAPLDTIKSLSPRKSKALIGRLQSALGRQLFADHNASNLALSNADINAWEAAGRFLVTQGDRDIWDEATEPDLQFVAERIKVENNDYAAALGSVRIVGSNEDHPGLGTSGTLLSHLHGEIRHGRKTYFLLAGRWYEVDATFINAVSEDFARIIQSIDLLHTEVGLRPWLSTEEEGTYNESSIPGDLHVNGDRILTDNVELFDTLDFSGNVLRIIHVKQGFNVKIRDVRSQLISSAQMIENDIRINGGRRKAHHKQLVDKGRTTLTETDFVELFERPREYVLAYGNPVKVTPENHLSFRSSIAKMELVSLNSQFRQISSDDSRARFRLMWIPIK